MYYEVLIILLCIGLQPKNVKAQSLSSNLIQEITASHDLEGLIIDILNYLLRSTELKCFTIVCDDVYLNIFRGETLKKMILTPYFIVVVKESEDLLSPNFDTLGVIRQSRRDGCEAYIILIANGFQAARFIKFGDRHRIIDTRGKFVILHDFRLFRTEMHYVWKRIVNVVFIRHHAGFDEAKSKSSSWFDMSTVPFPTPIRGIVITKRLDTWRRGKFYNNNPLFEDKTRDLKGQTLNVVYLEHVPAVTKSVPNKYGGLEFEIVYMLAKIMNFVPKLYEPINAAMHQWGCKQINGSFSGLLGEMVAGKADIALGDLQYTPHHLQLTDLTIPYISQCLTFLTPESLTDNSWMTLILPFRLNMWAAVVSVLFITGIVFCLLANCHINIQAYIPEINIDGMSRVQTQKPSSKSKQTGLYLFSELINSILYTYGMLLLVSLPKLPTGWSLRLMTGWYWLYSLLLVVSYRASMTAILANPTPRVTIDTLDQLVESKITCGGWGDETKRFFQTSLDETGQQIGEKFENINDPDEAVRRVANGELAYYENVYFLKYISVKRQNTKWSSGNQLGNEKDTLQDGNVTVKVETKGDRNLHIMTDCVVNMPISLGLQKNSPLKPRADKYLRRIIEVGLVEKWLNDVMGPIKNAESVTHQNVKALMNLKKLYGAFIALGIGYVLGVLSLVGELLHWHCIVRKDPNFDKYALDLYYSKK